MWMVGFCTNGWMKQGIPPPSLWRCFCRNHLCQLTFHKITSPDSSREPPSMLEWLFRLQITSIEKQVSMNEFNTEYSPWTSIGKLPFKKISLNWIFYFMNLCTPTSIWDSFVQYSEKRDPGSGFETKVQTQMCCKVIKIQIWSNSAIRKEQT
jgi:hypothetical protein